MEEVANRVEREGKVEEECGVGKEGGRKRRKARNVVAVKNKGGVKAGGETGR